MNQENPYAAPQTTDFTEQQNFGGSSRSAPGTFDPRQEFAKRCKWLLIFLTILVFMGTGLIILILSPVGFLILATVYLFYVWLIFRLSIYPALRPRRLFAAAAGMMLLAPLAGFIGHTFFDVLRWRDQLFCINAGLVLAAFFMLWAFMHVARHEKERWLLFLNGLGLAVLISAAIYMGYLYWIGHKQWGTWKPIYGIFALIVPLLVLVIDLVFGSNLKGSLPELVAPADRIKKIEVDSIPRT